MPDRNHETLHDLLSASGRFPLKDALHITIDLCNRLMHDRDQGRFYVSLSPENVSAHTPILIHTDDSTNEDDLTSSYVSPEIRSGEQPDERSTIWSLGLLLFEILTDYELAQADHENFIVPDLVQLRSDIPESLALLIYRMLEHDPDLRICSLDDVRHECERIISLLYSNEPEKSSEMLTHNSSTGKPALSHGTMIFGMTRFVGRTREMTELRKLLNETDDRLITIVGLGGIGKSRLAYELARELADRFHHGVYFVPLNPIRSPALIVLAISNAMGFTFIGNEDTNKQLIRYLRGKEMLLILDDFDELIEGSDIILDLLDGVPELRLIVTSRERLNIRSERVYELGGLPIPGKTDENIVHNDSIELFVEHAVRVHPGFSLEDEFSGIVSICTLLEGMPLGIEISASWSRVLTCKEIAKEIEENLDFLESNEGDIPERHRGIRATFDRSWDLLAASDRKGLARLSVFSGGFRREAAKEIADVGLDMLVNFVDKSLLRRDAFGRFQVHELIRQYLKRKLSADSNEHTSLLKRHSNFFGKFLSDRTDILWGEKQREAMDEIEVELPNIRLAWKNALSNGQYDIIYSSIEPLYLFHQTRGWFKTCDELFEESLRILDSDKHDDILSRSCIILFKTRIGFLRGALGRCEESLKILKECLLEIENTDLPAVKILILYGLSELTRRQGDFDASVEYAEQCLSLAVQQQNRRLQANALSSLGMIAQNRGSYERATKFFRNSLYISNDLGYQRGIVRGLNGLGNVYYARGDYSKARSCFRQGREKAEELGERNLSAILAGSLGNIAVMLGDYDEAKRLYVKRLQNAQSVGDESGIARGLFLLGGVHLRLNELEEAQHVLEKSAAIYKKTKEQRMIAFSLVTLADVRIAQNNFSAAESLLRESLEIYEKIDLKQGIVFTLGNISEILLEQEDFREANRLLRRALRIAHEMKSHQSILTIFHRFASLFERTGDLSRAAHLYKIVSTHESSASDHRKDAEESLQRLNAKLANISISESTNIFRSTDPVILAEELLNLDTR